jgi:hypothetical protein
LHLADWRWERLTQRKWVRRNLVRKDGKRNHLWKVQRAAWSRSVGWKKELGEELGELEKELGVRPDLDLVETLFRPPISHEAMAKVEGEYNIFRNKVDGVVVRYVVEGHSIQLTVEGELPQASIDAITSDFVKKMSTLENSQCDLSEL